MIFPRCGLMSCGLCVCSRGPFVLLHCELTVVGSCGGGGGGFAEVLSEVDGGGEAIAVAISWSCWAGQGGDRPKVVVFRVLS